MSLSWFWVSLSWLPEIAFIVFPLFVSWLFLEKIFEYFQLLKKGVKEKCGLQIHNISIIYRLRIYRFDGRFMDKKYID